MNLSYLMKSFGGKKVIVTGAHGFKGMWLTILLETLGAKVTGLGLPDDAGDFYSLVNNDLKSRMITVDIRDRDRVLRVFNEVNPDFVFHLAAQPIVSVGYDDPYFTYSTNVMGSVNVLDAVRGLSGKVSIINVTSDKAYLNVEKNEPYIETDVLMGNDPYSSSKSCAELVAHSYRESFFKKTEGINEKILSTTRAGNVIGGGDFALNRIVPDMARALRDCEPVTIRNFNSVRPYEHVLDAVFAYVILAARQYEDSRVQGAYNVGPNAESILTTGDLVKFFEVNGELKVIDGSNNASFNECTLLYLSSDKMREVFDWEPVWGTPDEMLGETLNWYKEWVQDPNSVYDYTLQQVNAFLDKWNTRS